MGAKIANSCEFAAEKGLNGCWKFYGKAGGMSVDHANLQLDITTSTVSWLHENMMVNFGTLTTSQRDVEMPRF